MDPLNSTPAALDAEEYLHLGMTAMDDGRQEEALRFMKAALQLAPEDGRPHYLLGALHAEIGMLPRAIREIGRALELMPELATARFQLGMLLLSTGDPAQSVAVWQPLDHLAEEHPLRLFRDGMLAFLREDYRTAAETFAGAIARNEENPRLNAHMEKVLEQARTFERERDAASAPGLVAPAPAAPPPHPGSASVVSPAQHVLLAGYRKQQEPR